MTKQMTLCLRDTLLLIFLIIPFCHSLAQSQDSCIWIVTNRTMNPADEPGIYFGSKIDPQKNLRYVKGCKCEKDKWIYQLRDDMNELLGDLPGNSDIVIFVHGDHKSFDEATDRAMDIHKTYDVDVVLFTWPSKLPDAIGAKNFKNSQENVRKSSGQFYAFLRQLQDYKEIPESTLKGSKITLFHHSLGNYFLERLVEEHQRIKLKKGLVNNLILNAAAVNVEDHEHWIEKLDFPDRIYVTSNKQDFNLNGVRFFTKDGKQLGERIHLPLAKNATYINFTDAIGFRTPTGSTHTYYLGEIMDKIPNIRRFYDTVMHGKAVNLKDSTMFQINPEGLGYDILK